MGGERRHPGRKGGRATFLAAEGQRDLGQGAVPAGENVEGVVGRVRAAPISAPAPAVLNMALRTHPTLGTKNHQKLGIFHVL